MAQHIRPPQAFPAQTSTVATSASPPATDQRNLHKRICDKIGVPRGTTQFGTLKASGGFRPIVLPDTVYSALVTAGVDFSDMLYNSTSAEATEATNSAIPTMWNPGLHALVCISLGDSLTEGPTGSLAHPDLALMTSFFGLMGHEPGLDITYVTAEDSAYMAPDRSFTRRTSHAKSRLIFNVGHGGWRAKNQPGYNYVQGSPHLDNIEHFTNVVLHPRQMGVVYVFLGTNDKVYADAAPNPGLAAVPTGTPGYVDVGSPNFFTDALSTLLAGIKLRLPSFKIIFQTPIARGAATPLNNSFAEIAAYAKANKVALGIDIGVDSREIPEFDPRQGPTVTANTAIFQSDKTHLVRGGYLKLGEYKAGALDIAQGFAPQTALAAAYF